MVKLTEKDLLVACEPWTARGPGWANAGVTFIVRESDGKLRQETVYAKDLTAEEYLAFSIAVICWDKLRKAGERLEIGRSPER